MGGDRSVGAEKTEAFVHNEKRFAVPQRFPAAHHTAPDDDDTQGSHPAALADLRARIAARPAPAPAANAPDPGQVFATFPRGAGGEVVRLALRVHRTADGPKQFVDLRTWAGGFPTAKGISVRRNELVALATALLEVADALDSQRGAP